MTSRGSIAKKLIQVEGQENKVTKYKCIRTERFDFHIGHFH